MTTITTLEDIIGFIFYNRATSQKYIDISNPFIPITKLSASNRSLIDNRFQITVNSHSYTDIALYYQILTYLYTVDDPMDVVKVNKG